MISGFVSEQGEIVVEIRISNPQDSALTARVEAIVDTGFTEDITLPPSVIEALGLTMVGETLVRLADGVERVFPYCLASIYWHGQERIAVAYNAPDSPLIGMSLLWGSRLIADIADSGDAVILPLER